MALDRDTRKEIEQFVRTKPRNINEIADMLDVSWRTADRYTDQMEKEEGKIKRRTFREGTRGALKIVYWNNLDSFNASQIQEQLLKKIEAGRKKTDFSPFDIYQCADQDKRNAFAEKQKEENVETKHDVFSKLREAQDKVLFFSGNLSWANVSHNDEQAIDVFRELAEDGVQLKFLGRVDVGSLRNTRQLTQLNQSLTKDRVSIRHSEQPLRAFIVDDTFAQFKEMRTLEDGSGLGEKTYLFYEVNDQDWVEWTQNVFWKLYRGGIPADRRREDLESIRNISEI
jgi:predicted transcriptional regulator